MSVSATDSKFPNSVKNTKAIAFGPLNFGGKSPATNPYKSGTVPFVTTSASRWAGFLLSYVKYMHKNYVRSNAIAWPKPKEMGYLH